MAGHDPAHEQLGHDPVVVPLELDRDVLDRRRAGAVDEVDGAVQELADDERLERALLEAPHVHQPGRDDLARVDRGHAGQRQEHAPSPGHLDDEAHRPRRPLGADEHDDVAHAADLVTEGIEHRGAGQACDEHPGADAAHAVSLDARAASARDAATCGATIVARGSPAGRPRARQRGGRCAATTARTRVT